MLVDCPDCDRSYHLAAEEVGELGRVVICPRCSARWFLAGPRSIEDVTPRGADWVVATSQMAEPKRLSNRPSFGRGGVARPAAILLSLALAATLAVGARARIVRLVPRAAGLYAAVGYPINTRGLRFSNVEWQGDPDADLTVAGTIRNVAAGRVRVPRVAFEVRGDDGARLLSWSERLPAGTLAGGRSLDFASAPHRLPPTSRRVLVSFIDGDEAARFD